MFSLARLINNFLPLPPFFSYWFVLSSLNNYLKWKFIFFSWLLPFYNCLQLTLCCVLLLICLMKMVLFDTEVIASTNFIILVVTAAFIKLCKLRVENYLFDTLDLSRLCDELLFCYCSVVSFTGWVENPGWGLANQLFTNHETNVNSAVDALGWCEIGFWAYNLLVKLFHFRFMAFLF